MYRLTGITCGDTELDVIGDSLSLDDVYDIVISGTDISVWEMIHSLDWSKIEQKIAEALYQERIN